ncbi:MAG TPA: N,N-dimethylformamidase beta subunit family domain-containing protein [Chloroflexota bacterium]|nr:N,N-dimethylformamidase beta subunit family domain-containing protein [Chloroflexota bacterium]
MLRRLVFWLLAVGLVLPLAGSGVDAATSRPTAAPGQVGGPRSVPRGPVWAENRRPGTTSWKSAALARAAAARGPLRRDERPRAGWPSPLAPAAPAAATWVDSGIRGYADQTAINHGGSVRFMVSTARPSYRIDVYRMGWYGGTGASLKRSVPNLPGQNQPVPSPDPQTGLIAANWAPSYTLQTDASWVSGFYLAKLTSDVGEESYIDFVVRDDSQQADVLYQIAFTTYQAYNNWGGKSLYDYQSTGGRAYKVSFDRPYADWSGAGMFFDGDYNMIRFLESQGYDLTYATSTDVEASPNLLNGRKVFLSNWHDEYWSKTMRDHLTAARNAGKHLAFFDSNNVYWQIRFESAAGGAPNRVIVCYKDDPDVGPPQDPIAATNPSLDTTQWRLAPVNQPENALLGVMFESLFDYGASFPWVVANASHWVYAATGLQNGQAIPGLIGYEYDKVWNNGQSPPGLQVLAASPVTDADGIHSTAHATIYQAASGALVFSAGTNYFPWKVDENDYQQHGVDARAQQIVRNVLNGMLGTTPPPTAVTATATPVSPTATRTPGPMSTPTRTATPAPAPACSPRPPVSVTTTVGSPGRLAVSVASSAAAHDYLASIQFGSATNALIDAGPLVGITGNATLSLPPGTYQYVFTVRRAAGGQAATVPLTVVTACGSWPTFVGGGPNAFQSPS